MILRIVHAAVPPEQRDAYKQFIKAELAPALRNAAGCNWVYVAECIEKGHETEVIYVSGWDSLKHCDALEDTPVYQGAAKKLKTMYTSDFKSEVPHLHYETFAEQT